MVNFNLIAFAFALTSTVLADPADFTGTANILVLKSDSNHNTDLSKKVGCLGDDGRFVSNGKCGVFTKNADGTIKTSKGNCVWSDTTQERNTDSLYGQSDYALHCTTSKTTVTNDEFFVVAGRPLTTLCFGDAVCVYDAKRIPSGGENLSLWQYHWGSQQLGITPGHVELQLQWNRLSKSSRVMRT